MRQRNRMMALLLTTAMLCGTLAGCGQGNAADPGRDSKAEQESGGNAAEESGTKQDAQKEQEAEQAQGYVPEKKLELTIWNTQGSDYVMPTELPRDVVSSWLEEKTLVREENIYGNDGGTWDSKLTKLIAGDNMPDIVYCAGGQGAAHFRKLEEMEQLTLLTREMVEQYAPEFYAKIPEEGWESFTTEDGKLRGIPFGYGMTNRLAFSDIDDETYNYILDSKQIVPTDATYASHQFFWIRDDILQMIYPDAMSWADIEELVKEKNDLVLEECMDIPITTTQEYIDFMYKIRDLNLKEDGKTVYAYGNIGSDNWVAITCLGADMYGYRNHAYTGTWNFKTGQYEFPFVHEDNVMKQAAKTQWQMINDGVIEAESLANTNELFKEKCLNGQYAIVPLMNVARVEEVHAQLASAGKTWRFRPFITQIPNMEEYPAYKDVSSYGCSIAFTKKLTQEQIIQVLNWINVQNTNEFESIKWWGPKEEGLYTETADGKRTYTDESFNKYFLEGDATALPEKADRLGLGDNGAPLGVYACGYTEYEPGIYNRSMVYTASNYSGLRFKSTSSHITDVKELPAGQIWNGVFAEIPEVVTYWSSRDDWEQGFALARAAKDEAEFERKWQEAVDNLKSIVDVEAMEKACTEAAIAAGNKEVK